LNLPHFSKQKSMGLRERATIALAPRDHQRCTLAYLPFGIVYKIVKKNLASRCLLSDREYVAEWLR
jgi:hypothetical protein